MSTLAERVELRLRTEWPGTNVPLRGQSPETIREGGATDALIKMAARIVADEDAAETVRRAHRVYESAPVEGGYKIKCSCSAYYYGASLNEASKRHAAHVEAHVAERLSVDVVPLSAPES